MAMTSRERHDLHTSLAEFLGENQASMLMEHLSPVGWSDVVTKQDLANQGTLLRQEVATLGAELRGEMTTLGTELRGETAALGAELRGELTTMRGEITTLGITLGARIDRESVDRKADMDALMSRVLREQRVFLTAIFLAISTLVAVSTIFG